MKKIAKTLIDTKILDRALLVGVLLEAGFMVLGHYRPLITKHFGLFGCMMIAGTAALLYARDLARGYVAGALGGLVIGAACGLTAEFHLGPLLRAERSPDTGWRVFWFDFGHRSRKLPPTASR